MFNSRAVDRIRVAISPLLAVSLGGIIGGWWLPICYEKTLDRAEGLL